jgi:two-component system, NarL family, response regulator DevR
VHVFLVEDSPPVRVRLEALLAAIPGATVVGFAEAAEEAIRSILDQRPHVVVLDMHLKEGTGLDVLRGLQGKANGTDVYVLTNYALEAYRQAAERLGARGFFDKSRDLPLLRDAIAARAPKPTP